jgi:hypothetical protein
MRHGRVKKKQMNNFIILAHGGSQVLFYFAHKAFWTDRRGKFICGTGSRGAWFDFAVLLCECAATSGESAACRESYFKVRARRQKARDRESSELKPRALASIWCFVLLRGDWRAFNYRSRALSLFLYSLARDTWSLDGGMPRGAARSTELITPNIAFCGPDPLARSGCQRPRYLLTSRPLCCGFANSIRIILRRVIINRM